MNRMFRNKYVKSLLGYLIISSSSWLTCSAIEPNPDSLYHRKEITIYGGLWNHASVDEMYSFQRYSGNSLFGGISFGVVSPRIRHLFVAQYAKITRKTDAEVNSSDLIEHRYNELKSMMIDFNYSFQRKVNSGPMMVFVTASWINSINYTLNEDDPEVFLGSIAPGLALEYGLKKHTFGMDFSIPVVSLALRDPYYISQPQLDDEYSELQYLKENLKIRSFGNLKVLYAQIYYHYQLSRSFLVDVRYQFRYISYKEPRPLRSVGGIYSAGFTYIF